MKLYDLKTTGLMVHHSEQNIKQLNILYVKNPVDHACMQYLLCVDKLPARETVAFHFRIGQLAWFPLRFCVCES